MLKINVKDKNLRLFLLSFMTAEELETTIFKSLNDEQSMIWFQVPHGGVAIPKAFFSIERVEDESSARPSPLVTPLNWVWNIQKIPRRHTKKPDHAEND